MPRIFVSIPIPEAVKRAAGAIQEELRRFSGSVAWVRGEGMHLTLKFLGEVPADRLSAVRAALAGAAEGCGPIPLSVQGVGVFPNPRTPRVIWLGVRASDDRLERLHRRVEGALEALGFPSESRPFQAHLTLGRCRSPRGAVELAKVLAGHEKAAAGDFVARAVSLMESRLQSGGAVYAELESFPL